MTDGLVHPVKAFCFYSDSRVEPDLSFIGQLFWQPWKGDWRVENARRQKTSALSPRMQFHRLNAR